MAQPSPAPVRIPAGISTDFPWGPLANYGRPNPFGYHTWNEEFDLLNPAYIATKTGVGTIAAGAAANGVATFTTAPLATDNAVLTLPFSTFQVTLGKKAFFLARLQLTNALNASIMLGLMAATATPFTGVPADGIWLYKSSGYLTFAMAHAAASVLTTVSIPPSSAMANNTNIDIGFYVDRGGNIFAFIGAQLVGWLPQSGTAGQAGGRGPVASLLPPVLTSALLMPVIAVQSGAAAAVTMSVDFAMAATER